MSLEKALEFCKDTYPLNAEEIQLMDDSMLGQAPNNPQLFKHRFPLIPGHPLQRCLLNKLDQGKDVIFKTEIISNALILGIVSNLVSNAGTTLVVHQNKQQLQQVQSILEDWGLGHLVLALYPEQPQLRPLHIAKRASYQPLPELINGFRQSAQCYSKAEESLQKALQAKPTWLKTYMQYLSIDTPIRQKAKQQGVNQNIFKGKQTVETVRAQVNSVVEGYRQVGRFQSPFNALNESYFRETYQVAKQSYCQEQLQQLLQTVSATKNDIFSGIFDYEQRLEAYAIESSATLIECTQECLELLEQGFATSKDYFEFNNSILGGFFGGDRSNSQIKEDRTAVLTAYRKLQSKHRQYQGFAYDFPNVNMQSSFNDLYKTLQDYKDQLFLWSQKQSETLQDEVDKLSITHVHPQLDYGKQCYLLSEKFDKIAVQFNQSQIFSFPLRYSSYKLRKRLQYLEELEINLKKMLDDMHQFTAYYQLKHYWIECSEGLQNLIQQQLESHPPKDAQELIEAIVLEQYLQQHALIQHWKDQTTRCIKDYQQSIQANTKALLNHSIELWAAKAYAKQKDIPSSIDKQSSGALLAVYPIVLACPESASQYLNWQQQGFDLGIFACGEANEHLLNLHYRCSRKVMLQNAIPQQGSSLYDYDIIDASLVTLKTGNVEIADNRHIEVRLAHALKLGLTDAQVQVQCSFGTYLLDVYVKYQDQEFVIDLDKDSLKQRPHPLEDYLFLQSQLQEQGIQYIALFSESFYPDFDAQVEKIIQMIRQFAKA